MLLRRTSHPSQEAMLGSPSQKELRQEGREPPRALGQKWAGDLLPPSSLHPEKGPRVLG